MAVVVVVVVVVVVAVVAALALPPDSFARCHRHVCFKSRRPTPYTDSR